MKTKSKKAVKIKRVIKDNGQQLRDYAARIAEEILAAARENRIVGVKCTTGEHIEDTVFGVGYTHYIPGDTTIAVTLKPKGKR